MVEFFLKEFSNFFVQIPPGIFQIFRIFFTIFKAVYKTLPYSTNLPTRMAIETVSMSQNGGRNTGNNVGGGGPTGPGQMDRMQIDSPQKSPSVVVKGTVVKINLCFRSFGFFFKTLIFFEVLIFLTF